MKYARLPLQDSDTLDAVRAAYRVDEESQVIRLSQTLQWPSSTADAIRDRAGKLVTAVRAERRKGSGVDALMHEYQLSSEEGVVLMCLAEALLRVPDGATADRLIEDKLTAADWEGHLGHSESLFVNASTWGLVLSGRLLRQSLHDGHGKKVFRQWVQRCGEPVVRQAVRQAMRVMARHFVTGRSIEEALQRSQGRANRAYRYSFDMLGEAARTQSDSERYFDAYVHAINAVGRQSGDMGPLDAPGISVKLSALYPRFEMSQADRALPALTRKMVSLARLACHYDIGLTIDAEEADRLELTMAVFDELLRQPQLAQWQGLGLAVQAYQKRAYDLLDWIASQARQNQRSVMIRLVKGAYWDTEIKRAQEDGLDDYPVFTRKQNTDISYLACAQKLFSYQDCIYPQFATHNAYTVAAILELADPQQAFEFQRLHGMGEPLYDQLVTNNPELNCRVYAPVGSHEDLLPYLVRRLLENGANTSFVNRIMDDQAPLESLTAHPQEQLKTLAQIPHPRIPLPADLYPDRRNSRGMDLSDVRALSALDEQWQVLSGPSIPPVTDASIESALEGAFHYTEQWRLTDVNFRAGCLEALADLLEERMPHLIALCCQEGRKSIPDGVAEVREAVDFCRYYAAQARQLFDPQALPGPTGESNQWRLRGRGVFVCISPWNFPLAIFLGQISAALVAGNTVIAKPAEQTPAIAWMATQLMYQAGIPEQALYLLAGDAGTGARLVKDSRVAGVAFTGSELTARRINQALASREAAIATLIAETGGLNAMLVDSSALLEQVVVDVLRSGFQSAGQRCSALRILLVQEDVAPALIELLRGAMDELIIGDPADLATDVGPVIDENALASLYEHIDYLEGNARLLKCCELSDSLSDTLYFAPRLYEISRIEQLSREVFGPIVHLLRFRASDLDRVIDQINATGYGLTFGIHSRISSRAQTIASRINAGNVYVNRNMIGAVVGVQPFGGSGLSGTGPKAGGPLYLTRFTNEQSISIDTTAAGGNASLFALSDDH
ncbi:bifunctional proline dehydrogenase/L-glutamate gamma-semialdehyde dehydrogenase PutA [Pseudohongiella spirulinae]|uniref:Bifunctional protein PutA n=1 Tax=Pseudohongiella spirulinae TaxID=1249552 RepID=A0A0S2KB40_9GAMM|nr:bifunctional proline dehydrogenase/L-glutamate gamma-semialdehyde dehydrogenase PutA [Pseudohongiella spirulinae]ALO45547.1 integrase [Pseudohongiella spirulinae]